MQVNQAQSALGLSAFQPALVSYSTPSSHYRAGYQGPATDTFTHSTPVAARPGQSELPGAVKLFLDGIRATIPAARELGTL